VAAGCLRFDRPARVEFRSTPRSAAEIEAGDVKRIVADIDAHVWQRWRLLRWTWQCSI
jgi:hypothetical protein